MNQITRNIFSISIGQVASLLISLAAITIGARHLGVEDFGLFSYLLAIVSVVSKIIDFGFAPIVLRESSKNVNQYSLLNTAISLRLTFSIGIFILTNITILLLGFTELEIILLNVLLINLYFSSKFQNIRELFDIPFKSRLMMHLPMAVLIFDNILFLILVFVMKSLDQGLMFFVISYFAANIPGFLIILFFLKKKFNFKFNFSFDKRFWLIKQSIPLYIFILLISLFQQLDSILIKNLDGLSAAGIYSAAIRLTMPLQFIITPIVITAFPIISRNFKKNPGQNELITVIIFKFIFFISFLIAVFGSFKSSDIILLIFGEEYKSAFIPFSLLLWTQIFLFFNFFSLDIVTAINHQKITSRYATIMVIINLSLLILLIPSFSFEGAAYAKLITALIGSGYLVYSLRRLSVKFNFWKFKIFIWIILIPLAAYFLAELSLLFYILTFISMVALLTITLRFFNNEEVVVFLRLIKLEKLAERFNK